MLLKDYVPFSIANIKELKKIYNAQQKEISKLHLDIKDLKAQCFVKIATWGLALWEEFVGINTDISKAIEERRANILAKLRGQGTTTKKVIEEIAQAYADIVQITEHNKESYFIVDLESYKGYPYELNTLYDTIEEIQPAHLEAVYNLTSTTNSKFYIGATILCGEEITVYPWSPKEIESKATLNIALGNNTGVDTTTIYPKKEMR